MRPFIIANLRWIAAGFLLLFASSFGQTFFIALSGGAIRAAFSLTDGGFGTLYMAATLTGALGLVWLGPIIDRMAPWRVMLIAMPALAAGMVTIALAPALPVLFAGLCLLRLFGQGMMVHIAYTALGRWFAAGRGSAAGRGRAVSLSALGLNLGQAVLPLAFVAGMAAGSWQLNWLVAAALLLLLVMPLAVWLARVDRVPGGPAGRLAGADPAPAPDWGWTRAQVLRDPCFYGLLLGMLPPAFISNTIFFHQVHLGQLRGWPADVFASAFTGYALVTVAAVLLAGQLIDRFSARALLPAYLLPMGAGCLLLGLVDAPWAAFGFMMLYGISDGASLALFGSLWPEIYGTRFLGAIRAAVVALMVFASALGPGIGGALIDLGVAFPAQITAMGLYCLLVPGVLLVLVRRLDLRTPEPRGATAT